MESPDLQVKLFQYIKGRMGAEVSAPEELARLLDISTDSAYRRMRGEKQVSFEELVKLCTEYKISLDQFLNLPSSSFLFTGNLLNDKTYRYEDYLKGVLHSMAFLSSTDKKEFYYLCKDVPFFYHWQCREFATFKYFFWMSTLIYFPEFRNKKVNLSEYSDEMYALGQQALHFYNMMDSFEVWNLESLNATLHQVEYYQQTQMFESEEDVIRVYDSLLRALNHIEEQAKMGYKFDINDPQKKQMGRYQFYINDIILLDNSILVVQDNAKMAFVLHSVINYMMTRDIKFCDNLDYYIQNLLRRSTLISETSEKERTRFFRILRERIERRKEKLNI